MHHSLDIDFNSYDEVVRQAEYAHYTRICAFVAASIVVYDTIITMDREVELIWKKRWSLIKSVYLFYRYFGLFCVLFQVVALNTDRVSDKFCTFWFYWEAISYTVLSVTSETVLGLWTWLIYNRGRGTLVFFITLLASTLLATITILVTGLRHLNATAHAIPGVPFCFLTHAGPAYRFLWLPVMTFYLGVTALSLHKAYVMYVLKAAVPQFGVLNLVVEHTVANFVGMTTAYVVCCIMWLTAAPHLAQVPVCFCLALSVTDCTRLLMNIRRAYYHADDDSKLDEGVSYAGSFENREYTLHSGNVGARRRRDSLGYSVHSIKQDLAVAVQVEVTEQYEESTDGNAFEMSKLAARAQRMRRS